MRKLMRLGVISARDLDDSLAALKRLGEPLASRALADALNHTANQARIALRAEMESVFDRPTPWVLNSIRVLNATPKKPVAALWVNDGKLGGKGKGFDYWFLPQVFGGKRLNKGSEKMLRSLGVMRPGQSIVPTDATPLDASGGINRGWMIQVLSGLRAFKKSGSDHNATDSQRSKAKGHAKRFFVIKRGKTPIGIAERLGEGRNNIRVVLQFSRRKPQYRGRFRFHDVVRRVDENDAQFEANIDKAIADALAGKLPTNFNRRARDRAGNIIR